MAVERRELADFIKQLALDAGKLALEGRKQLKSDGIHSKATDVDLVTDVDKQVEAFIDGTIRKRFPDHGIFGEESGIVRDESPWRWVVDPIDGTTNFIHDLPYYCVSIALQYGQETILGAVYAPKLNELFTAEVGKGARLNGEPIHVSAGSVLRQSLLSTGFACVRAGIRPDNFIYLPQIARASCGIRRYGSAALDLCNVAAGRCDGY